MNTMKKKIWKMSGAVLMALTLTIGCIGVNTVTVQAAEYGVAPATAVLYTGSGAEVFAQPDPATLVTVLSGDVPLQVTGMTSNGYFQVIVNDGIFYVYGKALSAAVGTNAYKLTSIDAKATLVGDAATGQLIYAQNAYDRLAPASTTKILTAYVALKYGDLNGIYTVSENAADQASDSSVCNLKAGEQLSLQQLLYGLLLRSGNDAAIVIAEGISGDVSSFAELMNKEAKMLGATDSHFVNANGLQDENHYTTVYDLYLIFQAAIQNPTFVDIIHTTEYTVDYLDPNGMSIQQVWTSTNKYLMGTETAPDGITVIGGKTGTTNDAGYCLVLLSNNAAGNQIVSIVMKADCRNNLYYYMNELLRQA